MTDLRQLLAFNIKQNRHRLGISQAKLAEKAKASTQYIAMIELGRKFPSPEMLDRLAKALGIDNLDLLSPPPFRRKNLEKIRETVLSDLERKISRSVNRAVRETVSTVITGYMMEIKNNE
jgi:transcriptional regulator with XRE-family HTH domain